MGKAAAQRVARPRLGAFEKRESESPLQVATTRVLVARPTWLSVHASILAHRMTSLPAERPHLVAREDRPPAGDPVDEAVLLRLALWLVDVAAEAARTETSPPPEPAASESP